jgi:rare lipoprotein A
VPDAEPRIEPIRPGGPNKPYEVLGKDYVPLREDTRFTERGLASWYGKKFHGRRTASGEVYNMYAMTAAHKTMPIPSYARVRNPANGREIIVRVNDRGPFHRGRVIDLSYTAAMRLGVHNGIAPVEVERITHEDIRTGAWRRNGSAPDDATASAGTPAPAPSRATGGEAAPEIAPTAAPAPSERADTAAAQGYWIQLGAFRQREGAVQFQQRVATELEWLSPLLAVFSEPTLFRLQAGPYPSRGEAASAAERVRDALQLVPVIVEKRR